MMSTLEQQLRDSIELEMASEALNEAKSVPELSHVWMVHCEELRGEAREILRQLYGVRLMQVTGIGAP